MNAGRTFASRIKTLTDSKINPAVLLACLELQENTLTDYLTDVAASKSDEAEKGRLSMTVMPQIKALREAKALVMAHREKSEQPDKPRLHNPHLR